VVNSTASTQFKLQALESRRGFPGLAYIPVCATGERKAGAEGAQHRLESLDCSGTAGVHTEAATDAEGQLHPQHS